MRALIRRTIAAAGVAVLGCSPELRTPTPGELVSAPPRLSEDASCNLIRSFDTVDGRLVVSVSEKLGADRVLGRLSFGDGAWQTLDQTVHGVSSLTTLSVSVAPSGAAFAAIYPWQPNTVPEIRRTTSAGWTAVPFDASLNLDRYNAPNILALDGDRAVLTVYEVGGEEERRERAFALRDGAWTPVELYRVGEPTRSFHRGPSGQLWRATPPQEAPGSIRLDEWNGAEWVSVGVEFPVTESGRVKRLAHVDGKVIVLYDTTTINDAAGLRLALHVASNAERVTLPSIPVAVASVLDLSFDSAARPVMTFLTRVASEEYVVNSMRLEDGTWQPVLQTPYTSLAPSEGGATVAGDVLYVGWSVPSQEDTTCAVHVRKVDLAALDG